MNVYFLNTVAPFIFPLYLLLGFVISYFLYFKDRTHFHKPFTKVYILLIALRSIVIAIILFLITSPFIQTIEQKINPPIIVVGIDNSESIVSYLKNKNNEAEKIALKEKIIHSLDLSGKSYDIDYYTFGDTLRKNDLPNFSEQSTNVESFFNHVEYAYKNKNLLAVVLLTDGIINVGRKKNFLKNQEIPVYTVGLGKKDEIIDVAISGLRYNHEAFINSSLVVNYDLTISGFKNREVKLFLKDDSNKTLDSSIIKVNSLQKFVSSKFVINHQNPGQYHYKITATTFKEEKIKDNNIKDFYINVNDNKTKVLLLSASVHPDVKAIKQSLLSFPKYELKSTLTDDFNNDFSPYDVVVFHQVSSKWFKANIPENRTFSSWFILGTQSDLREFNYLNLNISFKDSYNPDFVSVGATLNKNFSLFESEDSLALFLTQVPPLNAPLGDYVLKGVAYNLFYQVLKGVPTQNPLLTYFSDKDVKNAYFLATGLWKWRIYDYKENYSHNNFNKLITSTVDFLASENAKSRLEIDFKTQVSENLDFTMEALFYNDNNKAITLPDINLSLKQLDIDKVSNYQFSKASNNYTVNLGLLPKGHYSFSVATSYLGKDYLKEGQFWVKSINLELATLLVDHQWLKNLSLETKGLFLEESQLSELSERLLSLKGRKKIFNKKNIIRLIKFKFIFFIILILLAIEWLIRKINGLI